MPKRRSSKKSKSAAGKGNSKDNNRWGKNNGNVGASNNLDSNLKKEDTIYAGVKFLSDHFEHDAEKGTAKYSAKYELTSNDKIYEESRRRKIDVGSMMLPLCVKDCAMGLLANAEKNGIQADRIGITFCSDKIPFGGKICEPINKRNMDLDVMVDRILDKLHETMDVDVELNGKPFEIIVDGVQQQQKAANDEGQKENADQRQEEENDSSDEDENSDDDEIGPKLLAEKFEENLRTRTVKYSGTFKYTSPNKMFFKLLMGGRLDSQKISEIGAGLLPDSFNQCVDKMMAHGRKHDITPNCIGFTLRSPQLRGGVYSEPLKPNVNLTHLLGRMIDVICDEPLALEGDPYTMIITGQQRDELPRKEPSVELLEEHFEQDKNKRRVKYTGKFQVACFCKLFAGYSFTKDEGLDIVLRMFPKCFEECLQKTFDHGARYAIKPSQIGLIVRSENIPVNGGEICESVKARGIDDLWPMIRGILDKLEEMGVDLMGPPFTVVVEGIHA